jgi:rhodanese-related sulfurtransferase/rubrerythrin
MTVKEISPEELRRQLESLDEGDYALVDVRQPEEYEEGHLPGAKLVPLLELEQGDGVPRLPEVAHGFFYCVRGARGMRGAIIAADSGRMGQVYSLAGGLMAWEGKALPGFPRLKVFEDRGTLRELLMGALELEKGAYNLYQMYLAYFEGTRVEPLVKRLADAELGHGKRIYGALKRAGEAGGLPPFPALFGRLRGDVLEGGLRAEEVMELARQMREQGGGGLLELALELEYRAHDLYRSLALRDGAAPEQRETFLDLAHQEKRHVEGLLRGLGELAGG